MTDFLEINEKKKTIKSLKLEDFSIDNLKEYIFELQEEIKRVEKEIGLKESSINEAEKYFK